MQFKSLVAGAAVLLALVDSSLAVGSATVVNNCGYTVYYASVSSGNSGQSMTALHGSYSQTYSNAGTGYSIKISPNNSMSAPLTQFEFTWYNGNIAYDLSNINGYPFGNGGVSLTPSMSSDSSHPSCVPVNCPAGESYCSAAYNQPDDTRTLVCSDASNLVLTLCPSGSSKRDPSPAPEPVPEPTPTPEATPEPTPVPEPESHVHGGHKFHRVHSRHLPKNSVL